MVFYRQRLGPACQWSNHRPAPNVMQALRENAERRLGFERRHGSSHQWRATYRPLVALKDLVATQVVTDTKAKVSERRNFGRDIPQRRQTGAQVGLDLLEDHPNVSQRDRRCGGSTVSNLICGEVEPFSRLGCQSVTSSCSRVRGPSLAACIITTFVLISIERT